MNQTDKNANEFENLKLDAEDLEKVNGGLVTPTSGAPGSDTILKTDPHIEYDRNNQKWTFDE